MSWSDMTSESFAFDDWNSFSSETFLLNNDVAIDDDEPQVRQSSVLIGLIETASSSSNRLVCQQHRNASALIPTCPVSLVACAVHLRTATISIRSPANRAKLFFVAMP
jgi:hypothetical protein